MEEFIWILFSSFGARSKKIKENFPYSQKKIIINKFSSPHFFFPFFPFLFFLAIMFHKIVNYKWIAVLLIVVAEISLHHQ